MSSSFSNLVTYILSLPENPSAFNCSSDNFQESLTRFAQDYVNRSEGPVDYAAFVAAGGNATKLDPVDLLLTILSEYTIPQQGFSFRILYKLVTRLNNMDQCVAEQLRGCCLSFAFTNFHAALKRYLETRYPDSDFLCAVDYAISLIEEATKSVRNTDRVEDASKKCTTKNLVMVLKQINVTYQVSPLDQRTDERRTGVITNLLNTASEAINKKNSPLTQYRGWHHGDLHYARNLLRICANLFMAIGFGLIKYSQTDKRVRTWRSAFFRLSTNTEQGVQDFCTATNNITNNIRIQAEEREADSDREMANLRLSASNSNNSTPSLIRSPAL